MRIDHNHSECTIKRPVKPRDLKFGMLMHTSHGCSVTFMYLGYNRKIVPTEPGWEPGNGKFPGMKVGQQFLQITGKPLRGEGREYEVLANPRGDAKKVFTSAWAHIPDWA